MPGSKLIEYGELQGRLAITVDAAAIDFDDETSLTRQVLQSRVVGAAAVILEGKVPWGSHALDRQPMLLQADGRTEGKEVWAMRPIASERWASIPLWWVLDASALFQQASAAGIMAQIDGLPFLRYREAYTLGFSRDATMVQLRSLLADPRHHYVVALRPSDVLACFNGAPHARRAQRGPTPTARGRRRKLLRCRTQPPGWTRAFARREP